MPKSYIRRLEQNLLGLGLAAVILTLGAWGASATILDAGTPSSDGLVAEYRFDTGAGNTAYDTAGNNDGTLENGAEWAQGIDGKSASFDGQDDFVETDLRVDQTGSQSYTFSVWAYPTESRSSRSQLIGTDGTDGGFDWALLMENNDWYVFTGEGSRRFADLDTQEWQHLTAVYDTGSDEVRVYKNGKLRETHPIGYDSTTGDLAIGQRSERNDENFPGRADEVRIYSSALNTSQIKSIYNSGSWRIGTNTEEDDPSKVLDISFQHQNNTHVYDTSGYENHGTRENGVGQASSVDCKIGRCYSFDGDDDYVDVEESPGSFSDSVTVTGWLNPDRIQGENRQWLVEEGDGFMSYIGGGNSKLYFRLTAGQSTTTWNSGYTVKTDEWQHIGLVYDGTTMRAYVDGSLVGTRSKTGDLQSIQNLKIGADASDSGDFYNGKIDQVKVFNRSLSQSEIVEKTQGLDSGGAVLDLRFNRDGGDLAEDSSGAGNEGRIVSGGGSRPERVRSVDGNAIELGGDGDGVDIPSSTSVEEALSGEEATIAFWVDLGEISGSYNTWFPWTATNDQGSQSARLEHEGNGENIYTRWIVDPASAGFSPDDGGAWARGLADMRGKRFLHVSTFETTESGYRVRTYINDEIASESTSSEKAVLAEASNVGSFNPSQVPSTIDNLQIYPYALTPDKVEKLHTRGTSSVGDTGGTREGLVLSQTFNRIETCGQSDTVTCPSGASGEIAVDESGEANHGELVSSPEVVGPEECIVGTCIRSTESSRIQDEDPSNLPVSDSARTLSGWFKMTDTDKAGVFGYGNPNTNEGFQFYTPNGLGDELQFDFWGTNEGGVDDVIPSIKEKWYHVAATYDGNTITVYRNGQKIDSASYTGLNTNSERFVAGAELDRNDEFEGLYDQIKVFDRFLSEKQIWRLYAQGRDRSTSSKGPVLHYPMQTRSSPVPDVSGEGNDGDINLLGEIGTFNTSDGEWRTVRFERKYEDPVVVGTSNTLNGESALSFEAKNVDPGSAQVRLCESEGENTEGCDNHGTERASYMVVSASATEDIPGIEAGTLKLDSEIDSRRDTVSYSESFGSAPNVMANVNTDNGRNPVEARVTSFSASSFNIGICYQDSTNGCDPSHVTEEVGYVALEPGNLPFEQTAETGRTGNSAGGSNFVEQTFSNTYQDPAVVVSTVSEDGGQETQIDEAANLGPGSVDVRYCEIENGDVCNGHTSENVAWFVAEEGLLTYSSGSSPRYTQTKVGRALSFDGADDSVPVGESPELTDDFLQDSITMSAHVKPDQCSGTHSILGKSSDASNDNYRIYLESDCSVSVYIDGAGGTITTSKQLETDSWTHITATYNGNERSIYFDGRAVKTTSASGNMADASGSPFALGSRGGDRHFFDGKIAEARLYPYGASKDQVEEILKGASTVR